MKFSGKVAGGLTLSGQQWIVGSRLLMKPLINTIRLLQLHLFWGNRELKKQDGGNDDVRCEKYYFFFSFYILDH